MCQHIVDPGVMQCQSAVDREQFECPLILVSEVVPFEPVHHLYHPYHSVLADYRHTEDTFGLIARLFVDVGVKTGVLIRVRYVQNLKRRIGKISKGMLNSTEEN